MVTPVHAFIIFEHEKGHNTALKDSYQNAFTFKNHKLCLKSTQHPSTVVYENLEIKEGRTICNAVFFSVVMVFFSLLVYLFFIYIY